MRTGRCVASPCRLALRPVPGGLARCVVLGALALAPIQTFAQAGADDLIQGESVAHRLLHQRESMVGRIFDDPAIAVQRFTEELQRIEQSEPRYGINLVEPLMNLGHAQIHRRDKHRAYGRALKIVKRHVGTTHPLYGRLALEAGANLADRSNGRYGDRYLPDARAIFEPEPVRFPLDLAQAYFYSGVVASGAKNEAKAVRYYREALAILATHTVDAPKLKLRVHHALVLMHQDTFDHALATEHCLTIGRALAQQGAVLPTPLVQKMPEYPQRALVSGDEAFVAVEFTVDRSGYPRDIRIAHLHGRKEFALFVRRAVAGWRYAPAFEQGEPRAMRVRTSYRFSLSNTGKRRRQ